MVYPRWRFPGGEWQQGFPPRIGKRGRQVEFEAGPLEGQNDGIRSLTQTEDT